MLPVLSGPELSIGCLLGSAFSYADVPAMPDFDPRMFKRCKSGTRSQSKGTSEMLHMAEALTGLTVLASHDGCPATAELYGKSWKDQTAALNTLRPSRPVTVCLSVHQGRKPAPTAVQSKGVDPTSEDNACR